MSIAKRKSFQAVIVLLIVTAIILAGAFAWYSFTQQAINIFEGFTNPGVNLHDDFDGINKDVYVENNGQRPLYVRVRFDEYMDIDGNVITSAGNKDNVETWPAHFYLGTGDAHFCNEPSHQYYSWTMGNSAGDADKGWKYYLPSPFSHRALFDTDGYQLLDPLVNAYDHSLHTDDAANPVRYGLFDGFDPALIYTENPTQANETDIKQVETPEEAYIRIEGILDEAYTGTALTGVITPAFTSGTNRQYLDWLYGGLDKASTEANRIAIQTEINTFLSDKKLGYWDLAYSLEELDDNQYYDPSNRPDERKISLTPVTFDKDTHFAESEYKWVPIKRTLSTVKVHTMSQWIAAGMPTGDFWVMDTDGWCYWANVLLPTQSTGLLMSEVLLDELNPPAGVWYYGINVSLQAVTAEDITRFALTPLSEGAGMGGGVTEEGQMVLDSISSKYVFGVKDTDLNGSGGSATVKPDATFYTYQKFGDNTYRLVTPSGNSYAYGPLFIYTGATSASAQAMNGIYKAYTPVGTDTVNGIDNSEYKVGATFWKKISATKWAQFTVLDAEQGSDVNDGAYSGVFEAKNGKHYVKLQYVPDSAKPDEKETAWLAVGENGVFNALVTNTGGSIVPAEYSAGAGAKVSNNDDILIWTEEDEPGIAGSDRFVEETPEKAVKIGDVLRMPNNALIDGHEWLVIGRDANDSQGNQDKTLIIAVDVSANVAADGVEAALTGYADSLNTLKTANTTITPILLTVQEAMDYFANNSARAAKLADGSTVAKWWVAADTASADGNPEPASAIDTNGAFGATTADGVGIRIAMWIDTDKLNELIYPAS